MATACGFRLVAGAFSLWSFLVVCLWDHRVGGVQLERPQSREGRARRGRTSWRPTSGGPEWGEEASRLFRAAVVDVPDALVVGGVVSHPPIRLPAGKVGAMTVVRGSGLLSQVRSSSAAVRPSHGVLRAHPGSSAALGGCRQSVSSRPLPVVWGLDGAQDVVGAGQQAAGDRGGGDLLAAAVGEALVGGGEFR